jgi:hypothetical protein
MWLVFNIVVFLECCVLPPVAFQSSVSVTFLWLASKCLTLEFCVPQGRRRYAYRLARLKHKRAKKGDCCVLMNSVYSKDGSIHLLCKVRLVMKMAVFWVVSPCSLVDVFRRFRGSYCLHHQGDHFPDDGGRKHL